MKQDVTPGHHESDAVVKVVGSARVITFGRQRDIIQPFRQAKVMGRHITHVIQPPSGPDKCGFQSILDTTQEQGLQSGIRQEQVDGVVVPPDGAAILCSNDCPIITFSSERCTVVVHAGRPALTAQSDCSSCTYNIISAAMRKLLSDKDDPTTIHAHIAVGICQDCFEHCGDDAEEHLQYFRRMHPELIIGADRRLDLISVIRKELTGRGVPATQITHDGRCSKEDPGLASNRGGDTELSNMVLVTAMNLRYG